MVRYTKVLALVAAAFLNLGAAATATAAESDPNGDWTWTFERGDRKFDIELTLKVDGEKLTGSIGRGERTTDISDGTFKDGEVSFKVVRERNGQTFSQSYQGKVEGDTIKGTIEFDRGGESRSRDWEAKRKK